MNLLQTYNYGGRTSYLPHLYAFLIIFLISILTRQPVQAATFTDLTAGAWYVGSVSWAVDRKIVSGYEDGSFRPEQLVKEAEFVAMLLRASASPVQAPAANESWYVPYYSKAEEYRLPVSLTDEGRLLPISRGLAARLIAAYVGHPAKEESEAIRFLLDSRISQGKTAATVQGYEAELTLTRAEAVTFVRQVVMYAESLEPSIPAPAGKPSSSTKPDSSSKPVTPSGNGTSSSPDSYEPDPTPQTRPVDPVTAANTEKIREQRLQTEMTKLGLVIETTSSGYKVPHPSDSGSSGAILTKTESASGELQLLDAADSVVLHAGFVLLQSAGISAAEQQYKEMVQKVSANGSSQSLKIGSQILTVVRSAPAGGITVRYTLLN
jgi:hypothetical protein